MPSTSADSSARSRRDPRSGGPDRHHSVVDGFDGDPAAGELARAARILSEDRMLAPGGVKPPAAERSTDDPGHPLHPGIRTDRLWAWTSAPAAGRRPPPAG